MMAQNINGDQIEDGNNDQINGLPPTDKAILVLNTKPFEAKPLVFDLNGEVLKTKLDINFCLKVTSMTI